MCNLKHCGGGLRIKNYVEPMFAATQFNCPWCGVCSHQRWSGMTLNRVALNANYAPPKYKVAICDLCHDISIWHNEKLAYPRTGLVAEATAEMPQEVKNDFEEALRVFQYSPRASAALLRLSIQKLCICLELPGKNLNDDIGTLVSKGLPDAIRQSLDVVRVVGNNQVHPGVLDVRDDPQIAMSLFDLVNIITEYMIANPKRIQALHDRLPVGAQEQIVRRDRASN